MEARDAIAGNYAAEGGAAAADEGLDSGFEDALNRCNGSLKFQAERISTGLADLEAKFRVATCRRDKKRLRGRIRLLRDLQRWIMTRVGY